MSNRIGTLLVSLLLPALCAGCGGGSASGKTSLLNACPALPASTAPAGSLGATVDALVAANLVTEGLPGMTVSIAKNGKILYAQGYGYADLVACTPAQADTEYAIGSVTKQFTAAAILQLQQAGSINIDNPIGNYLSGYTFDPHITLRMLLNQTSGLADYTGFPAPPGALDGLPEATVLTAIAQHPILFPPGSAYSYSNSNYYILGSIIEAVSTLSYADYLVTHVFQPAGLTQTSYTQPAASAQPYSYDRPLTPGSTGLAAGIVPAPSVFFAAGALWSNVTDLATWDGALLSGKVIPPAQFAEMVTPPVSIPVYQLAGTYSSYAMGWIRSTAAGHPFIWHNGETLAYTAFNGMFLDDGFSISILTNIDGADAAQGAPMLPFAVSLIQAICSSASTAANC